MSGIFRTIVALILVILSYFVIDWIFELPYAARLLAAAAGMSVVGYVVWKHLIRELQRIQDDDEIALRLESRNLGLRGRLISTLQLTRAGKGGEFVGSPELISALEEETLRMSQPLDFSKIINTEMLVKFGVAALVIMVLKGALVWKFPDYFAALASRLVDKDARFPTKTKILEIKVPSGNYVPRGEELPVEVTVEGDIPTLPGTIYFESVGKDSVVPIDLLPIGGPKFKGTLSKALEDVDLIIQVGDARSEKVRVKVVPRPEIDINASGDCVRYTLPAYTKEKETAPEKFGGLSALAGSTASLRFRPTKALLSATLEKSDGTTIPLEKEIEKKMVTEGEKQVEKEIEWWKISAFPIDKSGAFHLNLLDIHKLENSKPPVEYSVDARPDLPPIIKLMKPTRDITVTPMAKLNVSFVARDDWGLRTVWIVYRVLNDAADGGSGTGTASTVEAKRIERQVPHEKNPPLITFVWEIAALNPKVGDQVVFWLEADDDCNTNDTPALGRTRRPGEVVQPADPNAKVYSRSTDVKLTIVSKEDKALELQAEVERLYQLLTTQTDNQEELKAKVRILLEEINNIKKQ